MQSTWQDIQSHKSVVANLIEKSQQVADPALTQDITNLDGRYQAICNKCQEYTATCSQYVDEHQRYQDNVHEWSDWLKSANENLSICDDLSGNKHSIEFRLMRLKVLMSYS